MNTLWFLWQSSLQNVCVKLKIIWYLTDLHAVQCRYSIENYGFQCYIPNSGNQYHFVNFLEQLIHENPVAKPHSCVDPVITSNFNCYNIYIFFAITLDETSVLVTLHFLMQNIYQSWSRPCHGAEQRQHQPVTLFTDVCVTGVPPLGCSETSVK